MEHKGGRLDVRGVCVLSHCEGENAVNYDGICVWLCLEELILEVKLKIPNWSSVGMTQPSILHGILLFICTWLLLLLLEPFIHDGWVYVDTMNLMPGRRELSYTNIPLIHPTCELDPLYWMFVANSSRMTSYTLIWGLYNYMCQIHSNK